jgi:hypothetical protein
LAQQGAGLPDGLEQGGLCGVHRLGRAGEAAVQVQQALPPGRQGAAGGEGVLGAGDPGPVQERDEYGY